MISRRRRRRRTLLAATLAAALLTGACGGSDRLSEQDYKAQAKQICVDAKKTSDAIKQPTKATPAAIADYFQRVLAANEKATDRFKSLKPPEKLQKAHDATLKANDAGEAEVRRVVKELQNGGDPRTVLTEAQGRLQKLNVQAGNAARQLGVPECGDRGE